MTRRRWTIGAGVVVVLAAYGLGRWHGPGGGVAPGGTSAAHPEAAPSFWTCSMHPQIRLPEPGPCPICAMDLIPVFEGGDDDEAPRRLVMSPAARALAEIQTALVERRVVEAEVRMVGKVAFDETRVRHITAWVGGRIDRLYVDYTGIAVREGDHLVSLYSPVLLSAQEELLQGLAAEAGLEGSPSSVVRGATRGTVAATRDKLRLLGLTEAQVAEIEARGSASDHVTIHAPQSGVVIEKHALEGQYVQTGTRIYTIADLFRVWVKLDAYESDVRFLRFGQRVRIETASYPGDAFEGQVAFIDPVLDDRTRTVKVRVNVDNADGRLKPGMFVRATARPRLSEGGRVVDATLAGKWISPMHPEVVKDGPGVCDVCGMDLVPAETMGYVDRGETAGLPLVIPATAPLITGRRAVVYVEVPGADRPTFEGREVVLLGRAGDWYLVKEGLAEGERVVLQGAFKIDSALQIKARPSMMSPEGGAR